MSDKEAKRFPTPDPVVCILPVDYPIDQKLLLARTPDIFTVGIVRFPIGCRTQNVSALIRRGNCLVTSFHQGVDTSLQLGDGLIRLSLSVDFSTALKAGADRIADWITSVNGTDFQPDILPLNFNSAAPIRSPQFTDEDNRPLALADQMRAVDNMSRVQRNGIIVPVAHLIRLYLQQFS